MKKRIISIFLAVVMLVGLIPLGATVALADGEVEEYIFSDTTFSGTIDEQILKLSGDNDVVAEFNNVTFENLSGPEYGTVLYSQKSKGTVSVTFNNCRFINCGSSNNYGGVICIYGSNWVDVNFNNCVAYDCMGEYGGFIYSNNSVAAFKGNGTTVLKCCESYYDGGAIYLNYCSDVSGFTISDCKAGDCGGAIYNNCGGSSNGNIKDCKFFRNEAQYYGGAVYVRYNGTHGIINCQFYKNLDGSDPYLELGTHGAGYEIYVDSSDVLLKDSVFYCFSSEVANYEAHIYGIDLSDGQSITNVDLCVVNSLELTEGADGAYHIENVVDWDKLWFSMQNGNSFDGKTISLECDIAAYEPLGIPYYAGTGAEEVNRRKPFGGIFRGNGHSITYIDYGHLVTAGGLFAVTDNDATISELTVYGLLKSNGEYYGHVGGIVGDASKTVFIGCSSYVEISVPTTDCVGGIVGSATNGTCFFACKNFGNIFAGKEKVGGIAGCADGIFDVCENYGNLTPGFKVLGGVVSVKYGGIVGEIAGGGRLLNTLNTGDITADADVGGLIGYEAGAVEVENGHNFGTVTKQYIAPGEYIIYTALDNNKCLDIRGGKDATSGGEILQIWTAEGEGSSTAKVFTVSYDTDSAAIAASHSGLYLMRNDDYEHITQEVPAPIDCSEAQRWSITAVGNGYYTISNILGGYMDVLGGATYNGAQVGLSEYIENDKNQLFRFVRATGDERDTPAGDSISGHKAEGSYYELCLYNRDGSLGDDDAFGLPRDVMWGDYSATVGGIDVSMPDYVNNYIYRNNREADGWAKLITDEKYPRFVFSMSVPYLDKIVGDDGRVTTEKKTVTDYEVVTSFDTVWGEEGCDLWYVSFVDLELNNRPKVLGNVHLILVGESTLTAPHGITVNDGNEFTIYTQSDYKDEMGKLVANGGARQAGIGGDEIDPDAGSIVINGGDIYAEGGRSAAGIGSANGGESGNITVNGGIVVSVGGKNNSSQYDAAGAGGGYDSGFGKIVFNAVQRFTAIGSRAIGSGSGRDQVQSNIEIGNKLTVLAGPDVEHLVEVEKPGDESYAVVFPTNKYEIVLGHGEAADYLYLSDGEMLPVRTMVGSKYVLSWTDNEGNPITVFDHENGAIADFVETGMLKVKFQFIPPNNGVVSMRVLAAVDDLERYNSAGWVFSLDNADPKIGMPNVSCRESDKVYNAVMAEGKRLTTEQVYAGSKYSEYTNYIFCFDIMKIPTTAAYDPIYVRSFVELDDGTIVYGDVKAIIIANYVTI